MAKKNSPDLEGRLEYIEQALYRMMDTIENMSAGLEEVEKELLRLTRLLEEKKRAA